MVWTKRGGGRRRGFGSVGSIKIESTCNSTFLWAENEEVKAVDASSLEFVCITRNSDTFK